MASIPLPQGWTWETLVERLGSFDNLERSARATGAIHRARVVKTASQLLRLILAYVLGGLSFRSVAAWAEAGSHASMSDVALLKRVKQAGPWLRHIVGVLTARSGANPACDTDGRRVVAVDATMICTPGDKKNYHLLHTVYDLTKQCFRGTELTDRHTAEALDVCGVEKGEIRLGDRAYGRWRDLSAVVGAGADYLVRLSANALKLRTPTGDKVGRGALCQRSEYEGVLDETVTIHATAGKDKMEARLIVLALPPAQAAEARRVMRQKARKWGYTPSQEALATAACLMLITSLPRETWPASRLLALYRRRWQVELAFKRLKSLIGLEELRVHDADLVNAWIHAVILVALLIDLDRPSQHREGPDSPPRTHRVASRSRSGVTSHRCVCA